MAPEIGELLAALPAELDEEASPQDSLHELLSRLSRRPIPVGRLTRLWALGTLQAKIALAYLAWWVRTGYQGADERARKLNEAHLKAAIKLLGTMSYLRGSVMKIGQLLANYPDLLPEQFVDMLGMLYFEAPPMHFSLLREHVRNELGADPEEIFNDFETEAFAAASLGQVHRARLKTGRPVAVKIQYPNIGRTIRDDFGNFSALVTPMRLSGDWDNLKEQWEDIRGMLELETDYENEAECLRIARLALCKEDEFVVPRVYPEYSSKRVLTMDYVPGRHVGAFMKSNPSQELRDRHGRQILLAAARLYYHHKLIYTDPQPGNYLFMNDGRIGLIDFGSCHEFTDDEWDYASQVELASKQDRDALRPALLRAADMTDAERVEEERLDLMEKWCEWVWEPLKHQGPFDFGDPDHLRRGMNVYGDLVKKRYYRSKPVNTWLARSFVGVRAMLYRLKARVDMKAVLDSETTVRS